MAGVGSFCFLLQSPPVLSKNSDDRTVEGPMSQPTQQQQDMKGDGSVISHRQDTTGTLKNPSQASADSLSLGRKGCDGNGHANDKSLCMSASGVTLLHSPLPGPRCLDPRVLSPDKPLLCWPSCFLHPVSFLVYSHFGIARSPVVH